MRKVVVLGCAGMAGHVMAAYLRATHEFDVIGVARGPCAGATELLDVLDFAALEQALVRIQPDYVINCIGVLVSKSANDIGTAIQINSYLPHFLSRLGKQINFKLIHISTDCVFSGKQGGYSEGAFRDGDDNYARTKALGEVINDRDLTIRTSIIGPELKRNGTGLLDWFLKQQSEIHGYAQAYWSGVTTLELAKATHAFIQQNISGLYHLCYREKISKYNLLKLFAAVWGKTITITPAAGYVVDKSLVCSRQDFDYAVPDYETMLIDMHAWMEAHPDLYLHYQS
ncbi:MAG: SDR family oxidoreductase [Pseudomonadota bacterium]